MEAAGDRVPRARGGGNLAARCYLNADHVQKLLQGRRRRAAEEDKEDEPVKKYMDRICVPLLVPAVSFLWALFLIITRAPSWTSSAQMTGEQHVRAVIFHLCSVSAFALAVAVVAVLCRYLLTAAAHAGRTLAAVRFKFVVVFVFMVISICVGIDADWRKGAAVFLVAAAIASVGAHLWKTGETGLGAALNLLLLAAMSAGSSLDLDGWMGGMDNYYISSWRYVSSGVYGTVRD